MNKAPEYIIRFFRWFCRPEYVEDIEGDLLERFEKNLRQWHPRKARFRLLRDVLVLFRPGIIKPLFIVQKLNQTAMFRHNLIITFRNFRRQKATFLINLLGLTVGISSALFIFMWIQYEISVDSFHKNDSRLFNVMGHFRQSDEISTWNGTSGLLAEALETEIPEISTAISATDPSWAMSFNLESDDKKLKAVGKYVDPPYFDFFSYPLIEGVSSQVLQTPNSIVISSDLADKLFPEGPAVGQSVTWKILQQTGIAQVTGIFEPIPTNSTDQFDFVLPFQQYAQSMGAHWQSPNSVTYVLLQDGSQLSEVNNKIRHFMDTKVEDSQVELFLAKYSNDYLHGTYEGGRLVGGRIENVRLFAFVALFLLAIACVNFINLSTAKAIWRGKEIGIKKTLGAGRGSLIIQYLSESTLLTLMSSLMAVILLFLILPYLNYLLGTNLSLTFSFGFVSGLIGFSLLVGVLAGMYPAFFLSHPSPINVLKAKIRKQSTESMIRKGLVVFQFALSIIFMLAVLVIFRQMQYISEKDLGYDKENLVLFENNGKVSQSLNEFLNQARAVPGVLGASAMTNSIFHPPGGSLEWGDGQEYSGFSRYLVYYDFIETMGLELAAGRAFDPQIKSEVEIVINESAVSILGFEEPLGEKVKFWNYDARIVGILKDFHANSLHTEVGPMFFHLMPTQYLTSSILRIEGSNIKETLERLDDLHQSFNAGQPLDARFLDQGMQALYEAENRMETLSQIFAGMAIFISALGLFGLATFTAEQRTKEVGIRKVLGSGIFSIISLIAIGFTKLVMISLIIALPIGFLLARDWLAGFAYHIDVQWWFFAAVAIGCLLLTWMSVGWQTIKLALVNPIHCLRDE